MPAKKVSTKTTSKKSGKTKTTTSKKNTKTTKSTKSVAKNTKETTTPATTDTLQAELDEQQLKLELLTEEFDDLVTALGEMKKRHAKEISELVNRAKQLRKNSTSRTPISTTMYTNDTCASFFQYFNILKISE